MCRLNVGYCAQSIPEKWPTMFTHDPKMPWAHVEKDERGKMLARTATLTVRAADNLEYSVLERVLWNWDG